MKRDEVSKPLRAMLWAFVMNTIERDGTTQVDYFGDTLKGDWRAILLSLHIEHHHFRLDRFKEDWDEHKSRLGKMFDEGGYHEIYGWLQFVVRHPRSKKQFATSVALILEKHQAAFRLVDDTFFPVASELEILTIQTALSDVQSGAFDGARSHLNKAARELTNGNHSDSVRESIHAVESVARTLEPTGSLAKALGRLESKKKIHSSLKNGFGCIYGYTSDEKGIRHPLLNDASGAVDETDAMFMLGACAAFVSYLIKRTQSVT